MNEIERQAPELRVQKWIGKDGESIAPFKLSDIGPGPKILFAFQHWCQGCHLHGFPTLQKLHAALSSKDVGFAVIQTVFEGTHENTFEKLREACCRAGASRKMPHRSGNGTMWQCGST